MSHIADRREMTQVDRRARAWQRKLVAQWCGHACPRLYSFRDALVAALFLEHGMTGPLPHDRLQLVEAATRREEPFREAFVTLALVDYVEDLSSNVGSALLPYQLAWCRSGHKLSANGLPGPIFRAQWPEVPEDETTVTLQPGEMRRAAEFMDAWNATLAGQPRPAALRASAMGPGEAPGWEEMCL